MLHVLNHSVPNRRSADLVCIVHDIIGDVLMPAGANRFAFLEENLVVIEPDLVGPHQRGHRIDDRRVVKGVLHLLDHRKIAVVGEETATAALIFASPGRSEEHTSELQSLMRISYAVFCLKKKKNTP